MAGREATRSSDPPVVEDDGLYLPTIRPHSLEKIRLHNRYAEMFTSSMRNKWPQLCYIGLYSGAGRARIDSTNEIVETSAISVLRQANPFTHYIYVDNNEACADALKARCRIAAPHANVTVLCRDVNEGASDVLSALPPYTRNNGLLSFCFIDPFDTSLRFSTIRALSHLRIDFLVLLMTGADFRRNIARYLDDPTSTRIEDLIDCPTWRDEFRNDGKALRFGLGKFAEAMQRIGYAGPVSEPVYISGKKVLLYNLVFYSKAAAALELWKKATKSVERRRSQTNFDFPD